MTTLDDARDVAVEVQARWPNHDPWPAASIAALHLDVAHIDASLLWETLHAAIEAGSPFPPSPAELAAGTKRRHAADAAYRPSALPSSSSCDHQWGHVSDGTIGTAANLGRATLLCVRCHVEQDARTGKVVHDPSTDPKPTRSRIDWLRIRYPDDPDITWGQHIARLHRELNPAGCGNRLCDLHEDVPA